MSWVVFLMNHEFLRSVFYRYLMLQPNPTEDASEYTMKALVTSGKVNTEAMVNLSFKISKLFSLRLLKYHIIFFKVVKGTIDAKPCTNLLL